MKTLSIRLNVIVVASSLSAVLGCAPGFDPEPLVADDGAEGPTPEWLYVGPIEVSGAPEDYAWHPTVVDDELPTADHSRGSAAELDVGPDRFGVVYVDFEHKEEYVAAYDTDALARAAALLAGKGMHHASEPGNQADEPAPKGLSHDVDNRISFADWSYTHSTLRRVGRVRGGCTGALFGNRLVLTAAHCIFDSAGNYLQYNTFAPRRNGSVKPYGEVTSQGAFYPIAYKNDGCNTSYVGACVKNDWAVLILPSNPWSGSSYGSPGYLGFAWAGDSTVSSWAVRNIGYPSCGSSMAPASCQSNVAYGDLSCAGVSSLLSDADSRWPLQGTNGKLTTGCDTSGGHSGGPIYSYSPGSNGPYIVGNTVWNQCNASSCNANTNYSSAGIRISHTLFDWMLSLRSSYP